MPGQKIDVGGYSLYIECAGSGSPTVILETGGPSASLQGRGWLAMRASVANETRVCAYDRADRGKAIRARPGWLVPARRWRTSPAHAR